ncbi:hypothetical protein COOONC_14563 [Cooperia oncophora]
MVRKRKSGTQKHGRSKVKTPIIVELNESNNDASDPWASIENGDAVTARQVFYKKPVPKEPQIKHYERFKNKKQRLSDGLNAKRIETHTGNNGQAKGIKRRNRSEDSENNGYSPAQKMPVKKIKTGGENGNVNIFADVIKNKGTADSEKKKGKKRRLSHTQEEEGGQKEMSLRKLYHDVEFSKCLRLSALNLRCTASQELYLTAVQYALLHETKLAILRSAGLCDIFMDHGGRVCLYGCVESVIEGHMAIKRMFLEQGLGEPGTRPPSALRVARDPNNNQLREAANDTLTSDKRMGNEEWNPDTSRPPPPLSTVTDLQTTEHTNSQSSTSGRGNSINQSCSYNSVANASSHLSPGSESSTPSAAVVVDDQHKTIIEEQQRKSIKFFVKLADAPRLIGTRGTNKRRIEQITGCTIVVGSMMK